MEIVKYVLKNDEKNYLLGMVVVTDADWLIPVFREVGFAVKEHCAKFCVMHKNDASYLTFTARARCYGSVDEAYSLLEHLTDKALMLHESHGWVDVE